MKLSSRQTAILLDTHESSVKRWCNAGELACSTTQGGHRRISVKDAIEFASANEPTADVLLLGDAAEAAIDGVLKMRRKALKPELLQVIRQWLLDADSRRVSALVRIARAFGIPLPVIYDRMIGEVMKLVGDSWAQGAFSIGEEHRVSESILDVLYGIQGAVDHHVSDSKAPVILGTIRGEEHVTGAMMVRTLLTAKGFPVSYLGRNVPEEDFLLFRRKFDASLICLSATLYRSPEEVIESVNRLQMLSQGEEEFSIAVGGSGAKAAERLSHRIRVPSRVRFFDSATDFMAWAEKMLQSKPTLENETR